MKFGNTHMSRIGNSPVKVPNGVIVEITGQNVVLKGPKGELTISIPSGISISHNGETIIATRLRNDLITRANHGTSVARIRGAIIGITNGWNKKLELSGVGYRAELVGINLKLTVGFSHPVIVAPPAGIVFEIVEGKISVSGIDKYLVGQVAANIRAVKPPEPYKGKGIKYVGERIRKKAGKSAKAVGGAPGAK